MTPLERAARALWIGLGNPEGGNSTPSMRIPENAEAWRAMIPVVRAVIAAIREPSEAMTQLGGEVGKEAVYCDDAGRARLSADAPREIWVEMIDAVLADDR